tara:strand:+ start:6077 stop:6268 length:192 start_codon:yes stop_codon:yes gene_type:complete
VSRTQSFLLAIKMTAWFVKTSWYYVTTKRFSSKVEFLCGFLPAWFRFTFYTYKDFRESKGGAE